MEGLGFGDQRLWSTVGRMQFGPLEFGLTLQDSRTSQNQGLQHLLIWDWSGLSVEDGEVIPRIELLSHSHGSWKPSCKRQRILQVTKVHLDRIPSV